MTATTVLVTEKPCGLCGEVKPAADFHRHPQGKGGLQSRCKSCAIASSRAHYRENREQHQASHAAWRAANPEKVSLYQQKAALKAKYGLTIEDYEAMLQSQGGVCAICGGDEPGHGRRWFSVDHDHQTGRIRGLLCNPCNIGLARFQDNAGVLMRAAHYLGADL